MTVFIDILSDDQSWAFALSLGNHSITVSEAGASGCGGGSGQIRLSPNVALKGAFDAGQGDGDAVTPALSPAVAYPFHDTLNTPGAQRNHG